MSRDDTIPLHSRIPRSSDHFRESAQGWYNPTTFLRTEVTWSIMDICPRMIQSLFILKDRGLQITLGKVPGMIQSHCNIITPPFREGLSKPHQACPKSVRTLLETEVLSPHHHLNHLHLHLQYVNTKLSPSVSPVCEYWKHHQVTIICIYSM